MGFNPRFVAYALSHDRSPDDQLAHDRAAWPGGLMCGFILWNRVTLSQFGKAHPEAFALGRLIDHTAYDRWIAERLGA